MHPRSAHKLWDPPGGIANTPPCPVVEFQEVSCPSPQGVPCSDFAGGASQNCATPLAVMFCISPQCYSAMLFLYFLTVEVSTE